MSRACFSVVLYSRANNRFGKATRRECRRAISSFTATLMVKAHQGKGTKRSFTRALSKETRQTENCRTYTLPLMYLPEVYDVLDLLIIDEEQGSALNAIQVVRVKKATVDVLTLSATPIPRTIHMAFDRVSATPSWLTSPRTKSPTKFDANFVPMDEDKIREAIEYEINRGGQKLQGSFEVMMMGGCADYLAFCQTRFSKRFDIGTGNKPMRSWTSSPTARLMSC